jgi:hypothetical protein
LIRRLAEKQKAGRERPAFCCGLVFLRLFAGRRAIRIDGVSGSSAAKRPCLEGMAFFASRILPAIT